jgi:ubiquinone/menaquinone biosynthesis C-methylase UbiE
MTQDKSAQAPNPVTQVARLYDQLAVNGPYGTLAPGNRGGRKSRYVAEVFDAALLPALQDPSCRTQSLLDYGCGTGIFTVQASALVAQTHGLDISEQMLEIARGLDPEGRVQWLLGDGSRIPLADQTLDWVVAREALCYVPDSDLDDVLGEITRVLRPGGRFLWLEQSSDDPSFQSHPQAPLLRKRPLSELRDSAERAGLLVQQVRCVRTPRFPWIFAVWAGLVPTSWLPRLARWEVAWHRRYSKPQGRRWRDVLLVLQRPPG